MRPRVFITQPVAAGAIARLREVAEVNLNADPLHIPAKDELLAAVRAHDVLFCLLHDRIDRDVVAVNPKLRMIASMTITPADIDTAVATAQRVPVTVIPSALLNDATADHAWALMFAVGRRIAEADRLARAGIIPGSQSNYLTAPGISGKTLGLVGVGGVGRAVAQRARGFPLRVIYHDPRRLAADEERTLGLTWVAFDELLATADYVSLHTNLNARTRHLIGERELKLMKATACLINTSRGPIVDEQALISTLTKRQIAGAGLDVFEHEPGIDPALLGLPNTVITPHMGSAVATLRAAMADVVVDNILALLDGRQPPNCWNREIYAEQPA
jgi:glyoxylate reductase